jgi:hypothetical protein
MHATPRNPSPASLCVLTLAESQPPPGRVKTTYYTYWRTGAPNTPQIIALRSYCGQRCVADDLWFSESRQWTLTGSDQDHLGIPYGRSAYSRKA